MDKIRRLPESELEVMQIVWDNTPPVSRATVEKALNRSHRLAPTTILTLLTRLCDKGFLSIEKKGRANYYTPRISRREYRASESRNILDRLYGGSLAAFTAALCDSGISEEELEQLHDLLERNKL
ncbi:BlaI/MecI/CopY family transcriptional regulator [Anaerovorax odorimutans]|uniref:BlaI/MecI/CopY family transcriptional regulator n=1 Tax=Anaerovorax odorimutans TaxID=109327 RepID=A0ABT1RNH0_9FIRM|nr:BlaI/MecI/CopY family transcriptional regulator [Anaerovorax odorimutans]MCQ4636720.1 BlaI/MecI/CopY family transcriptional regulator [Anaerovorax odorimutans]